MSGSHGGELAAPRPGGERAPFLPKQREIWKENVGPQIYSSGDEGVGGTNTRWTQFSM